MGAGTGGFLLVARKRGWDIFGCEISLDAIADAKKQYGIELKYGALEEQAYPSNFFSVVHINHTLEHVSCPNETLKEIHRVLKEDGLLVLEVPNEIDSLSGRVSELIKKYLEKGTGKKIEETVENNDY